MLWWLLYKIPLAVYCLVLIWMFIIHPIGSIVVGVMSAFVMIPWLLFARYVCRSYDESKRFNGRK